MKKILLGFSLILLAMFSQAQNGLENIVVEKYYLANAADATGSAGHGTLTAGSYTYRIYADMLPGYKFQMAYGNANHNLTMTTTTTFYNSTDYGTNVPTFSKGNAAKYTTMLDSWLSAGAACAGNFGVLKTEDDGVNNVVNVQGLLANNSSQLGIPLTTQDGLLAGAPSAVNIIGMDVSVPSDNGADAVFGDGSANGSSFILHGSAWSSLSGAQGPTASNRVLIAQITTDGIFHFELNIQIGTPTGGTQNYVFSNPVMYNGQMEITIPSLAQTFNVAPTVSITAPANNTHSITGNVVAINAIANDADGTVTQVQFFDGSTSLGTVTSAPYTVNYTGVTGTHTLTAVATDNDGLTTTSAPITLIVAPNQAPTVSITSPTSGTHYITGDPVSIAANASDVDGTVTQIQFFVDGVSIGTDLSSPYTASWTSILGPHNLTAIATDNLGATTTSAIVAITVVNNLPPAVSITAPLNGATITAPAVVNIDATATDADGSVASVQFFVNGVSIGTDVSSPYSISWTSVIGTPVITAVATDDRGATTTSSPVTVNVLDPNALPYQVATVKNNCTQNLYTVPFAAMNSISNVIGFDMVLNYDNTKITPTGVFNKLGDLLSPTSYFDISRYIDAAHGHISISVSLNGSAPQNTFFHGTGNLFSVVFAKTSGFNSSDTTVITVSSLVESYITGVQTQLATAGKCISYKDTTFNASVVFWNGFGPIRYNVANPNQYAPTNIYGANSSCILSSTFVTPDTTGSFTYNTVNGQDISFTRDILGTVNMMPVLNAGTDVYLGKKVLTNDPSFIPSIYQLLALDVNLDGHITAGDISQLSQRIVLSIPEFKQQWNYSTQGLPLGPPSKDWAFVDQTRTYTSAYQISSTYPADDGVGYSKYRVPVSPFCLALPITNPGTCPQISDESYYGILLGDVDGSFKNLTPDGQIKTQNTSSNDTIVFDIANAIINANYIDVPVSIHSTNTVNGIDFSTQYNHSTLTYDTIVDATGNLDGYSNYSSGTQSIMYTATENGGGSLPTGVTLAFVRFHNLGFGIDTSDLLSTTGYVNGTQANILKTIDGLTSVANYEAEQFINVYPNPASGTLNVITSNDSKIQMFDLSGKQVVAETIVNAFQKQTVDINNLANGIYMMKVYNDNFVKMQKVVINK